MYSCTAQSLEPAFYDTSRHRRGSTFVQRDQRSVTSDLNHSTYVQLQATMQLLLALATGAAALVAPTQRALPKTVRQFNFGDFGKSKDYASAQEKIRSYDNTQTVETAKYGKRAIRATQLNGQNVLNPEPACAAFIAFAAFECYLSAQACALAASRSVAPSHHASSPGVMDVGGFFFDSEAPRRCGQEFGRHLPHFHY